MQLALLQLAQLRQFHWLIQVTNWHLKHSELNQVHDPKSTVLNILNFDVKVWRSSGYLTLPHCLVCQVESLVLISHRTTCDIAPGTAWDTLRTYENICHRHMLTADVPAKLNSSQLCRFAGIKVCNGCCCPRHMFLYRSSIPGSVGAAATSQVVRQHMRTRLNR